VYENKIFFPKNLHTRVMMGVYLKLLIHMSKESYKKDADAIIR